MSRKQGSSSYHLHYTSLWTAFLIFTFENLYSSIYIVYSLGSNNQTGYNHRVNTETNNHLHSLLYLFTIFLAVGGNWSTHRKPHARREDMQTPHRKGTFCTTIQPLWKTVRQNKMQLWILPRNQKNTKSSVLMAFLW